MYLSLWISQVQLDQSNYYKILPYIDSTICNYIHGYIAIGHQILNTLIDCSNIAIEFIIGFDIIAISIEY